MGHLTAAGSIGRILFPLLGGAIYSEEVTGGVMLLCVLVHVIVFGAFAFFNREQLLDDLRRCGRLLTNKLGICSSELTHRFILHDAMHMQLREEEANGDGGDEEEQKQQQHQHQPPQPHAGGSNDGVTGSSSPRWNPIHSPRNGGGSPLSVRDGAATAVDYGGTIELEQVEVARSSSQGRGHD
jgi:hypothetical protein